MLVFYDCVVLAFVVFILLVLYHGNMKLEFSDILAQVCLFAVSIFPIRLVGKVYRQVWRFGGIESYIRLLITDTLAFLLCLCLEFILPVQRLAFAHLLSIFSCNLLICIAMRMVYRYSYKFSNQDTALGKFLSLLLHVFSNVETTNEKENKKIKVAIVGAGNAGVNLANDLMNNEESSYVPMSLS